MLRKGSARFQRLNRIDRQEGERAWDKNKVITSHEMVVKNWVPVGGSGQLAADALVVPEGGVSTIGK